MKFLIVFTAILAFALAEKKEKRGLLGLGGYEALGHGPVISAPLSLGHSLPYSLDGLGHGLSWGGPLLTKSVAAPLLTKTIAPISYSAPILSTKTLAAPIVTKAYSAPIAAPLLTKSYAAPIAAPLYTKTIAAPLAYGHGLAAPLSLGHGLAAPLTLGHGLGAPLTLGHGLGAPLALGHGLDLSLGSYGHGISYSGLSLGLGKVLH